MDEQKLKEMIEEILREIFKPDTVKTMIRGNFTKKQASLYLGKAESFLQAEIDEGRIGTQPDGRIAKVELDRYLINQTRYVNRARRY